MRDLGASRTDPKARGYQTREKLPLHNDSTDIRPLLPAGAAKDRIEFSVEGDFSEAALRSGVKATRAVCDVLTEPGVPPADFKSSIASLQRMAADMARPR